MVYGLSSVVSRNLIGVTIRRIYNDFLCFLYY